MLDDSYQFKGDTELKPRYSIPLKNAEFIIEQHDPIGLCGLRYGTVVR